MSAVEDIRTIVGQNVKLARRAAGLSQEALADKAQIDRTYVSGVERGLRNPSVTVISNLAAVLGATSAMLLTRGARFGPR